MMSCPTASVPVVMQREHYGESMWQRKQLSLWLLEGREKKKGARVQIAMPLVTQLPPT